MENNSTQVFELDGDSWIGYVEELRGANAQGKTWRRGKICAKQYD